MGQVKSSHWMHMLALNCLRFEVGIAQFRAGMKLNTRPIGGCVAAQFDTKKNNVSWSFQDNICEVAVAVFACELGRGSEALISRLLLAHSTLEANILTQKRSKGFLKRLINDMYLEIFQTYRPKKSCIACQNVL